jgi:hypothetical protein
MERMNEKLASAVSTSTVRPPHLSLLRRRAPILLFFAAVGFLFIGWGCWQEYSEYSLKQLVQELNQEGVKVSFYSREPEWLQRYSRSMSWSGRETMREIFSSRESSAELSGDNVRPEVLAKLPNIPNLAWVSIYKTPSITDDSLATLSKCQSLRVLGFYRVPISGTGLATLRELKRLDSISFSQCPITDPGLQAVRELSNVLHVNLQDVKLNSIQPVTLTATNANGSSKIKPGDSLATKCTFNLSLPRNGAITGHFWGGSEEGAPIMNFLGAISQSGEGQYSITGTGKIPPSAAGKYTLHCNITIVGPPHIQVIVGECEVDVSER